MDQQQFHRDDRKRPREDGGAEGKEGEGQSSDQTRARHFISTARTAAQGEAPALQSHRFSTQSPLLAGRGEYGATGSEAMALSNQRSLDTHGYFASLADGGLLPHHLNLLSAGSREPELLRHLFSVQRQSGLPLSPHLNDALPLAQHNHTDALGLFQGIQRLQLLQLQRQMQLQQELDVTHQMSSLFSSSNFPFAPVAQNTLASTGRDLPLPMLRMLLRQTRGGLDPLATQDRILPSVLSHQLPSSERDQRRASQNLSFDAAAAVSLNSTAACLNQAAQRVAAATALDRSILPAANSQVAISNVALATSAAPVSASKLPRAIGRDPFHMYVSKDPDSLSAFQCLARKHIEFFEAVDADVSMGVQGRNKPIVLGQVGIRCHHCRHLPPKQRARASTYYPAKLHGVYQSAQNIINSHMMSMPDDQHKHDITSSSSCQEIPLEVQNDLLKLQIQKSRPGGGKKYWGECAEAQGVYEDEHGLRFRPF